MKKNLILLASSFILTMSCVACNNNNSNSENSSSNNETSSIANSSNTETSSSTSSQIKLDTNRTIEIRFYHTMNGQLNALLDSAIDEFNEIYPNIRVSNTSAGGYDDVSDQLVTSIAGGDKVCDMVYCYPDHIAKYNKANAVSTLDKFIYDRQVDENGNLLYGMNDEQIDDFIDAFWDEGKSFGDDLMYSLPLSKSTELLYYNKTFFEQNNLSVPDHWFSSGENDTTSMEYVCEKIITIDPTCIPLGYDSDSNWFITMCEQFNTGYTTAVGDNHYIFDNAENREIVSKLKSWYTKKYITTKMILGTYTSSAFTNKNDSGTKIYMSIGSSGGASNQNPGVDSFEVGVAKLPQKDAVTGNSDTRNGKAISQGPNICILKNDDPQVELACWLLLRYLTTNIPFQCEFSMQSGYSPVTESVFGNEIYSKFLYNSKGNNHITAQAVNMSQEQANWFFTSPAFIGSSEARTQVGALLSSALQGKDENSVAKAFEDSIKALQSIK